MFKFVILAAALFATVLSAPYYVSPVYDVYKYPVATSYSNRYDYYPYSKGKTYTIFVY